MPVRPARRACLVLLVLKGQQDRKATQVRRDRQALLAPLVRKDRKELQEQQVLLVLLDQQGQRATRG